MFRRSIPCNWFFFLIIFLFFIWNGQANQKVDLNEQWQPLKRFKLVSVNFQTGQLPRIYEKAKREKKN